MKESAVSEKKAGSVSAQRAKEAASLTRDGPRVADQPLMSIVQRAGCSGCVPSVQSMAGGMMQIPGMQRRSAAMSLQRAKGNRFVQGMAVQAKEQAPPNKTGMPDQLKSGLENISGLDLSGVRVHYSSSKPAQLNALAYTQGQEIHMAPGQERHLPHEGWHVVQQAHGRVRATTQLKDGVPVNDDEGLEHEADEMGSKALANTAQLQVEPEGLFQCKSSAPHLGGYAGGSAASQSDRPALPLKTIQRRNGARPQNFRVTGTRSDNTDCSVTTDIAWDSSNGNLADLADFHSREIVTFNQDPKINMPAYSHDDLLPFGMRVIDNVLTKPVGVMSNPGGQDKHTGVGFGPKFTVRGVTNLRRAAWVLVGRQYYETKQDSAEAWERATHHFKITRRMQQIGDQFSLTISKHGPNCNVNAGPTLITMETSMAMQTAGADRGDQTGEWNTARNTLANPAGNKPALNFNAIATDVRNNAHGVAVNVDYEYTSCADPANLFAAAYNIPPLWRNKIYQNARSAARGIISNVLTGANPPTRFIITIFRCAGVQQQALWTNENGGTYRVLLRADKLMDMGQWGGDVDTSMAGRESKRGWTDERKKERFSKAVAVHELGHMLHAFSAPNKFLTSTLMQANIAQIQNAVPPDPLAFEKIHICRINQQVIQALNGKGYKQKWGYAMNNPGEVVPEVFTAIQHGRNVPKGLAAVYVAYGGIRGGKIDAALQKSFGGAIPAINDPEDCIPIINS